MSTRSTTIYTVTLGELAEVPGMPFAYWAPASLRALFRKYPPLDRDLAGRPDQPKIADSKAGLGTGETYVLPVAGGRYASERLLLAVAMQRMVRSGRRSRKVASPFSMMFACWLIGEVTGRRYAAFQRQ